MFLIGWEMQYDKNCCSYRQLVIGSFIMTVHRLTHHVLCSIFSESSNHPGDLVPYNSDLASCGFWLFPKWWVKSPLNGNRFKTISEVQKNRTGQLLATPTKDFAECFEHWKRGWENCAEAPRYPFWRRLRCHCPMYNVSCNFNKCLYFSHYVAGYFMDVPYMLLYKNSSFCCSNWVFSTTLSSNLVIQFSTSFNLLLILINVLSFQLLHSSFDCFLCFYIYFIYLSLCWSSHCVHLLFP